MKLNRKDLLAQLNKATDRAASFAINRGVPILMNNNTIIIGDLSIEKNNRNLYDIISTNRRILYENIITVDIAIIIAQKCNLGETSIIEEILELENRFSKYKNDMLHYLYCMKIVKNDWQRFAILEDKFQLAESLAKITKDKISIFKRTK